MRANPKYVPSVRMLTRLRKKPKDLFFWQCMALPQMGSGDTGERPNSP